MKNNAAQKTKLPAGPVPDMRELTKEQLKAEIDKGFADAAARRVTPAAEVFAGLREDQRRSVSHF